MDRDPEFIVRKVKRLISGSGGRNGGGPGQRRVRHGDKQEVAGTIRVWEAVDLPERLRARYTPAQPFGCAFFILTGPFSPFFRRKAGVKGRHARLPGGDTDSFDASGAYTIAIYGGSSL